MFHENRSTCSKTKTGDTHFRQGGDLSEQSHRNEELASVKPGGNVLKNFGAETLHVPYKTRTSCRGACAKTFIIPTITRIVS